MSKEFIAETDMEGYGWYSWQPSRLKTALPLKSVLYEKDQFILVIFIVFASQKVINIFESDSEFMILTILTALFQHYITAIVICVYSWCGLKTYRA